MDQTLLHTEQKRRTLSNNPMAQGIFGLMGAAQQTWRNTWAGCLHSEVRYLSREMWGLVSYGFPRVETTVKTLTTSPHFSVSPVEVKIFKDVIESSNGVPDYLRIPDGFEPLRR